MKHRHRGRNKAENALRVVGWSEWVPPMSYYKKRQSQFWKYINRNITYNKIGSNCMGLCCIYKSSVEISSFGDQKWKKIGDNPQAYKKTDKMFRHLLLEEAEGYPVTFTKKRKPIGDINNNSIHGIMFYVGGYRSLFNSRTKKDTIQQMLCFTQGIRLDSHGRFTIHTNFTKHLRSSGCESQQLTSQELLACNLPT